MITNKLFGHVTTPQNNKKMMVTQYLYIYINF